MDELHPTPVVRMLAAIEAGPTPAAQDADVEGARGGDVAAFERLYRSHVGRVYALCLRLSADPVRAEELTQDVFVRAWERIDTFRGESAFGTWLHRIAVNTAMSDRRSRDRREARVATVEDPAALERGSVVPRPGERIDLERAMALLPPAARAVFVMHDVEGYGHREIAELTGRAEGTCKALLHRARQLLRERLA
jgi:RNA polymerase sigma-70 factor, ECF subfamily